MENFKKLNFVEKVLFFAPFAMWFSYYPNFHFGKSAGANLEFSIALIYIVVLALAGIKTIYQKRKKLIKNNAVLLTGFFVFWNFLTILNTQNLLRTVLVSGVWLVLWLDFMIILSLSKNKILFQKITKNFIFSSLVMDCLSVLQVIYGAWTDWGLCAGCRAQGFGFVRPSVFAIEPQFFGSMLLAPIILLTHKIFSKKASKFEKITLWILLLSLYLTLSRGAIFAAIFAILVLIFVSQPFSKRKILSNIIISMSFVFSSFLSGMIFHAIFTELNPRISDGFYDSISKSVNQMSLGKIKLPKIEKTGNYEINEPEIESNNLNSKEPTEKYVEKPKKAMFDGYVEKSTNERTKMSDLAIETWLSNPFVVFFGVGSGASGTAILNSTHQIANSSEIVQNEFLSILLELGFFGFVIWLLIIFGIFQKTRKEKYIWSIFVAFLVQWNFFSGLPNALHIYLILAVIFAIIEGAYEKKSAINRWVYTKAASQFFKS